MVIEVLIIGIWLLIINLKTMFGKLKDLAAAKKQADEMKKQLGAEEVIGEALNGQVRITMNGNQEIKEVFIDEVLLSPDNKEKLEEAIGEAFAKVNKELQTIMIRKMQSGELQMPQM